MVGSGLGGARGCLSGTLGRSVRRVTTVPEVPELVSAIDSCYTLFLREICEPEENVLRVVVQEASAGSETVSHEVAGTTIENLHRIESTASSRVFELTWSQYVAYSVRNESFTFQDDSETAFSGRHIRFYSKSHFLDYVSRTTLATDRYPGPFTHLCIISEMHVVDVISTQSPKIRLLPASSISQREAIFMRSRRIGFVRKT